MSKRMIMAAAVVSLSMCTAVQAQQDKAPGKDTVKDPVGYFLGISVGQQFRQSGFRVQDIELDSMLMGLRDGLEDNEVALTEEQLQQTQEKIQGMLQQRREEMSQAQKEKGNQFLAANAKKEGVKTLEGGVQYKVLKAGEGESPQPTDTVQVHYTGKLIDGTVFDSSVQRGQPATFRVNQVIQGWQMALQEMQVGDKWMLYIPSQLAYREQGSPPAIGPNEVLVFEVELLAVQ